jgi:hypothetical protein
MMHLAPRHAFGSLLCCFVIAALPCAILSQQTGTDVAAAAVAPLPEAPAPQTAFDGAEPGVQPDSAQQDSAQQTPTQAPAAEGSSSLHAPVQQTDAEKSQHDKAEEQLRAQEKQRVMGVMATFNTTSNKDALPLSAGQKFKLFFRSSTDPWPFLLAGVVAGIGQADDSYPEWGQGAQGYAKRYGGAYSDAFIGNFFGNALLPSWWHEDPRYFQKGTGKPIKRFLWAAASTVWCRRDKGTWGPNYSNIVGNLIGSAIARSYYPQSDRTVSDTITDGLTVSAEGIVGAEVIEFWPDLVRHHKQKQAEKLARQAGQSGAESAPKAPAQDAPKQ